MAQFEVTQKPGYWDNKNLHPPGSVIDIPEAEFGVFNKQTGLCPGSTSFKPLGEAAERAMRRLKKEQGIPLLPDEAVLAQAEDDEGAVLKKVVPNKK